MDGYLLIYVYVYDVWRLGVGGVAGWLVAWLKRGWRGRVEVFSLGKF